MRVGVIGAGIVGLCCAEALSRRGIEVVVFDKAVIPAPRAASNDARRLLRHAYPDHDGYGRMVDAAQSAWQQLWQTLDEDFFTPTGTLMLVRGVTDFGARAQVAFDRMNHAYRKLTPADIHNDYPFLVTDDVSHGVFTQSGGVLGAERILSALTRLLLAREVRLEPGLEAASVDLEQGIIRLETEEYLQFDRVLVTAGAWTPALIDKAEIVRSQRQVVLHVSPPDALADAWRRAPAIVDFGGDLDGYAVPPVDGATLTLAAESVGSYAPIDSSRIPVTNEGVMMLNRFRNRLTAFEDYRIDQTRVCFYAVTDDGRWHLHLQGRGLALTGCNGHMFKFGAMAGEMLADWVDGRVDDDGLKAWSQGHN